MGRKSKTEHTSEKTARWIRAAVIAAVCAVFCIGMDLQAAAVVVLDPGHGGNMEEGLGAVYPPYSYISMAKLSMTR